MLDKNVILRQSHAFTNRSELSDGLVIQQSGQIHTLNETAQEIFDMFDGTTCIGDIVDCFSARYPENETICETIDDFIRQLIDADLLTE